MVLLSNLSLPFLSLPIQAISDHLFVDFKADAVEG